MNLLASLQQQPVADLFVVNEVSLTTPPITVTPGGILSQRDLADQYSRERITVPELAGGFMRLIAIQGGLVGSVHVGDRTLVMFGASALAPTSGEVWDTLTSMARDLRQEYRKVVRGEVPPTWLQEPTPPRARPWLAIIPMDGMAWYQEHEAIIAQVVREVISYFLALASLSKFGPSLN